MEEGLSEPRWMTLLRLGADIVGGAGGAALGISIGGAGGDVLGASAAPVLAEVARRVLGDVAGRLLSRGEQRRIGTVAYFAWEAIKARLDRREVPRDDGFFEARDDQRADAEDIFEAVLLRARQEAQERKLKYLGNVFANAAFSRYRAEDLHAVVAIADRMSYRQLALLALTKRCREVGFDVLDLVGLDSKTRDQNVQFAMREWSELRSPMMGVIQRESPVEGPRIPLTPVGEACFELLGLALFPECELRDLVTLLRASR